MVQARHGPASAGRVGGCWTEMPPWPQVSMMKGVLLGTPATDWRTLWKWPTGRENPELVGPLPCFPLLTVCVEGRKTLPAHPQETRLYALSSCVQAHLSRMDAPNLGHHDLHAIMLWLGKEADLWVTWCPHCENIRP